jgi:hypothetical protein
VRLHKRQRVVLVREWNLHLGLGIAAANETLAVVGEHYNF